jgi:hypothetical protein
MSQIQVDNIYNKEATGGPNFPLGANVTGVVTATTFKGGAEITSGTISATSVTAASGTFNGPVTIGGTLTYEDVTNIDSVGVITARKGIKVTAGGINAVGVVTAGNGVNITGNIGLGGATYGTAGQVLTSGGSGANATWTSISAAPEISSNAASGISAGSAVVINSSGQIAGITSETVAKTPLSDGSGLFTSSTITGNGIEVVQTSSSSNKYRYLAFDPDNNIMIAQWKGSNNAITIKAYKLSSDGTWATSSGGYELSNQNYTFSSICYAGQGRFVSAYRDTSGNMRCRVLTVNTTTYAITVGGQEYVGGSAFTIQNDSSERYQTRCIWHPPTNKIIFVYCQSGSTLYRAIYGTMNYSSNIVDTWANTNYPIWGTTETFIINDSPALAYDPDTQKIIFYAFYNGSTASVSAAAMTINTSDITMGTRYEVQQGSGMASNNMSVGYDTGTNHVVFNWKGSNNNWMMRIASVASNGTITTVDGDTVETGQGGGHQVYSTMTCVGDGLIAFIWSDAAAGNMHMKVGKIQSNNTLHIGSAPESKVTTNYTLTPRTAVYNSVVKRVVVMFYATDQDTYLQSAVVSTVDSNSNGYVGIANTTVTSGQSLVVRTFGGTSSTFTGLSTGSTYYVQSNGTFSTTADADVTSNPSIVGGIALNGTTMLVKS